jgi:hypothetical protein
MITSELVLGKKFYFVDRIPLFLEVRRFLQSPAPARSSLHVPLNATHRVFENFLTVLRGGLPCMTADNSHGLKLLALEFKCDRLLKHFSASPDGDYALTQHENVIELLTHVGDLPLPKTDKSLKSSVTALPDGSSSSCASSSQSSRRPIPPPLDVDLVVSVPHGSHRDLGLISNQCFNVPARQRLLREGSDSITGRQGSHVDLTRVAA